MFLVIYLDHERIKLGQGYYYIVVIHLTNSLKGNLHQVNEFPRDVSDID